MKRQPTPDILGAILGAPPNPPAAPPATNRPAPAVVQPPTLFGWAALSSVLYRLAGQLQALADERGVLWLADADAGAVFGTASERTQANQLSGLKRAGVVSYSRDAGWFVRFLVVRSRTEIVQERTDFVQSRTTPDNGGSAIPHSGSAIPHGNRANLHDGHNGIVQSRTDFVQERTDFVRDCTENALLPSKSVSKYSERDTKLPDYLAPAPELPPQLEDPIGAAVALGLLAEAGIDRRSAFRFSQTHSLEHVRRAIGHWWDNRRSAGGEFKDRPGIVLTWLEDPDRFPMPPCSREFQLSDLYNHHLTPAELAALEPEPAPEPEPEPPPLVRVRDEDSQHEPQETDPGDWAAVAWLRLQQEYAADTPPGSHDNVIQETRFISCDDHELTVAVANSTHLQWLDRMKKQIGRRLAVIVGQPVAVKFTEV